MKLITLLLLTLAASYSLQGCCADCTRRLTDDKTQDTGSSEEKLPSVTVYDTPKTGAEDFDREKFCGKAWDANEGTCCNQAELHARAKAWKKRLGARAMRIAKGLKKFKMTAKKAGKMKDLIEAKKEDIKGAKPPMKPTDERQRTSGSAPPPPPPSGTDGGTGADANGGARLLETGTQENNTDEDVTDMKSALEKSSQRNSSKRDKNVDKAVSNQGQCFKALMKMRYDALCMRCSGKASDAFDAVTGSYKIKGTSCKAVVTACAAVFAAQTEAQKVYLQMVKLRKAQGKDVSETIEDVEPSDDQVDEWIGCADDTEACGNDTDKVNKLCGFLSLSKPDAQMGENPNTMEDGEAAAADNGTDLARRLLSINKINNFRRRLSTDSDDGQGYVKIDATSTFNLNNFESGDEDTGMDSSSAIFNIVTLMLVVLATFF